MVKKSTFANNKSSITWRISPLVSPRPSIIPDLVNIVLFISLTFFNKLTEAKYLEPGLTLLYKPGTVSMLWLNTSGLALTTSL